MYSMSIVDIAVTWSLGKRMQVIRQAANLEQRDMAERLGVSRSTISNWERGHVEPTFSQVVRYAKESGQSLEWLAEGVSCATRDSNPQPSGL